LLRYWFSLFIGIPSITKVQNANLERISNFADGLAKKNVKDIQLNNVEAVLFDFAVEIQKRAIENLNTSKAIDTGNLASSIRHELTFIDGSYTLQVFLPEYYDYINQGVRGVVDGSKVPGSPYKYKTLTVSRQMAGALGSWAARHNLKSIVQNKTFKHRSVKTFKEVTGYGLAKGVKKFGIKQTKFFDRAVSATYPGLADNLVRALGDDVSLAIRQGVSL
jgi:hypothetical protein